MSEECRQLRFHFEATCRRRMSKTNEYSGSLSSVQAVDKSKAQKTLLRLGNCEVCDAALSKYTCPRCEVKTCSLSCVQIHKLELECSGIRDKTGFKSLKKFSNLDLLSDYRFLEDISRTSLKYRTDVNKRYTRFNCNLPVQLIKLKGAAYSRGVRLLFLPQNFSKHRDNSTYYEWKSKKFYWRIEWTFFTISGAKKIIDNRVLDTDKVGKVLSKHLDHKIQDPELELYYSAGFSGVVLLLKCEKTENKYYVMDPCSSIRANLRRKTIIEYPSIFVVLKHRKDEFDLLDSDEDEELEVLYKKKNEISNNEVQIVEKDSDFPLIFDIS